MMMPAGLTRLILGCCLGLVAASLPGAGTRAAEAPARPDAAKPDAAKAAFDGLPEADRRAIQDALIWTGDSISIVTGTFGPRTRDAILAYAKRSGLPATGMLDAPARQKLLATAEGLRQAVGFERVVDEHAGLRIGLPRKLLGKPIAMGSGSRFSAADGSVVVDTVGRPLGEGGLSDVFDRMTVETEKRTVTYKVLRPEFFVVSGETGDQKFYARFASGTAGGVSVVRGFTFLYAKALARRLDPVSLAVAASFDPFPGKDMAESAAAGSSPPAKAPPTAAPQPLFAANAIFVAPGVALTRLSSATCPNPAVGSHAASFKAQDAGTGLALLNVPGAPGAPIALATKSTAPGTRLFALFHAGSPGALAAASVEIEPGMLVSAPFQAGAAGAALIDGSNALAGLAEANTKPARAIAGIILQTRYGVTDAAAIAGFLGRSGVTTTRPDEAAPKNLDLGDASSAWRGAVAPVFCTPKA